MNSIRPSMKSGVWVLRKIIIHVLGMTTAVLFLCLSVFSQSDEGRILGTIFDQSGGVVAGATVIVKDVARGVNRTLTTDASGQYNAPSLTPGTYSVRVESTGFSTVERQNISVVIGGEIRVDVTLKPGEQTQEITVTEAPPMVETTNATLGGELSHETITEIPLNGRNLRNLLTLRPGVAIYPGGGAQTQSTNGLRMEDQLYLVEGLVNANPETGESLINTGFFGGDATSIVPLDAVQELRTQESPKAEYGWRPGAIVSVGLKSGTNSVHGTAFAFGRSDAFDARNVFNYATIGGQPNPKTPVALEQWGGTAGGPIIKDKLFWFVGVEAQSYSVGNNQQINVPVTSLLTAAQDPKGNPAQDSIINACQALGPAKISPLSAQLAGLNPNTCTISPASSSTENLFPTNPGINPVGPTFFTPPLIGSPSVHTGIVKGDYHVNEHNQLSGTYFISVDNSTWFTDPGQALPQFMTNIYARTQIGSGHWTWTPNSRWVNELRSGWAQTFDYSLPADDNVNPSAAFPSGYGFNTGVTQTLPNIPPLYGMPNVFITSFSFFHLGASTLTRRGPDGQFDLVDDASYLVGNHTFKFGGEFLYWVADQTAYGASMGSIKFSSLQNYLQGIPQSTSIQLGDPTRHARQKQFAGFVQDDWRIKPRLTLNLGLRYEHENAPYEVKGRLGNFDPTLGLVQAGKQIPSLIHPDYLNFAPRFGIAWDIRGNGKTVLRAGASIIYETTGLSTFFQSVPFAAQTFETNSGVVTSTPGIPSLAVANFSFSGKGVLTCGTAVPPSTACPAGSIQYGWKNNSGSVPLFNTGIIACGDGNTYSGLSGFSAPVKINPCTTGAIDQNYKVPFVTTWNLDFQQQLTNDLSVSVTYLGNHGSRLLQQMDINQPHIGPGKVNGWYGLSNAAAGCIASASDPVPYDNCSPSNADEQLGRTYNTQFPYLKFINQYRNGATSNYDGVQVTLNQRATHGLAFLVGYTFSHAFDDVSSLSGPSPSYPQDTYNLKNEYANSDYDIRQRFALSMTYALPGIKSPAQLLKGWEINTVVALQTGLPWTAMDFNTDFTGTGDNTRGPTAQPTYWDFTGNPSDFKSSQNPIPYFAPLTNATAAQVLAALPQACVTAAGSNQLAIASLVNLGCYMKGSSVLTPPAYGSTGDAGRNIFRDRGFKNVDLSIYKTWTFTEKISAQFRAEFFNVLNHPEFANPYGGRNGYLNNDPTIGTTSGTFGCGCTTPDAAATNPVVGTGGARDIQFGLKLTF